MSTTTGHRKPESVPSSDLVSLSSKIERALELIDGACREIDGGNLPDDVVDWPLVEEDLRWALELLGSVRGRLGYGLDLERYGLELEQR